MENRRYCNQMPQRAMGSLIVLIIPSETTNPNLVGEN